MVDQQQDATQMDSNTSSAAQQIIPAMKLNSFLPAFTKAIPRNTPAILRSRNSRWTTNSIASGWGNRIDASIAAPSVDDLACIMPWKTHTLLFTLWGIYSHDPATTQYSLIFPLTPTIRAMKHHDYPWSHAFVGNDHFYSHPAIGIVKYDGTCDVWSIVDLELILTNPNGGSNATPSIAPASRVVYGICAADNRLILLLSDTVSWSCIDFGDHLRTNNYCGSGFQSLSKQRFGHPLGVYSLGDGFAVFTSNSIMIAAPSSDPTAAFQFPPEQAFRNTAINPFCIIPMHDETRSSIIYLAKQGFQELKSSGTRAQHVKWKPEQGNWIEEIEMKRRQDFNGVDFEQFKSVRLWHVPEEELLFVSFYAQHPEWPEYHIAKRSLVYHIELDKWSSFDQPHICIGDLYAYPSQPRETSFQFGFLHPTGMQLRNFDNSRTNAGAPLDSFIELGPLTFSSQLIDSMSYLQRFSLHMPAPNLVTRSVPASPQPDASNASFAVAHALGTTYQSTIHEFDSFSDYLKYYSLPRVRVNSSLDGEQLFEQNWCDATIAQVNGSRHNYTCNTSGLFHTISLHAEEVGEFYELNILVYQLTYGGRLY